MLVAERYENRGGDPWSHGGHEVHESCRDWVSAASDAGLAASRHEQATCFTEPYQDPSAAAGKGPPVG
jgi:hypothetical protein